MGAHHKNHWLLPFFIGFFAACLSFAIFQTLSLSGKRDGAAKQISETPGLDYIDAYQCASGEDKIVVVRGKEDNFSREGNEPAVINPKLLESPYFRDLSGDENHLYGFRDYDERGVDKFLFDYFNVPNGVVDGVLLLGVKAQGNIDSDAVSLGNLSEESLGSNLVSRYSFSVSLSYAVDIFRLSEDNNIIAIPLSDFENMTAEGKGLDLIEYLNRPDRRRDLDLYIQDDAMIDFSALALCIRPTSNKGTTFTEVSSKLFGPQISVMGCNVNKSQAMCDPFAGDLLCSEKAPLGCYKDGSVKPPDSASDDFPRRHFAGGTVRATDPVRGDSFKTYMDAVKYCRKLYGPDWRVLNFHEAGGTAIVTQSDIAVNSRIWVDVSDQTYANCWSREK